MPVDPRVHNTIDFNDAIYFAGRAMPEVRVVNDELEPDGRLFKMWAEGINFGFALMSTAIFQGPEWTPSQIYLWSQYLKA